MLKNTSSITAIGILLTSSAAILATEVAMPIPASAHEDHGRFSAGQPGDPKKPARVVKIKMFEGSGKMGFEPARVEVRRGEQVRFVLQNEGEEDHEFVLRDCYGKSQTCRSDEEASGHGARRPEREAAHAARERRARLEIYEARQIRVRLSNSRPL
jgi:uncharacterized cupredoxin-like copper-binding protein